MNFRKTTPRQTPVSLAQSNVVDTGKYFLQLSIPCKCISTKIIQQNVPSLAPYSHGAGNHTRSTTDNRHTATELCTKVSLVMMH